LGQPLLNATWSGPPQRARCSDARAAAGCSYDHTGRRVAPRRRWRRRRLLTCQSRFQWERPFGRDASQRSGDPFVHECQRFRSVYVPGLELFDPKACIAYEPLYRSIEMTPTADDLPQRRQSILPAYNTLLRRAAVLGELQTAFRFQPNRRRSPVLPLAAVTTRRRYGPNVAFRIDMWARCGKTRS
jgi:hypothetical protein